MENTINFGQDYLQEPPQVTPEKEQVAKAPGWYPKPPKKRVRWGQTRETPGWGEKKRAYKPETEEEAAERRKGWSNGHRLYHEDALVGAIHKFYKYLKRRARIVHIFHSDKPIVQVRSLRPPVEYKILFYNELDGHQQNSNRACRNWCKRYAAHKRRTWAETNARLFSLPWPTVEHKPKKPDDTSA